jgi:hypothetical protein
VKKSYPKTPRPSSGGGISVSVAKKAFAKAAASKSAESRKALLKNKSVVRIVDAA